MRRQVFIVWFLILLVWSFYRAYFRLPEALDEYVVKPLVFAFPVFYLVVFRERKSLATLGLMPGGRSFMTDLYIGVVLGIVFALEGLLANFLKYGTYSFVPLPAVLTGGGLTPFLAVNLATSLWEEILGRGFLYQRLYTVSKNQWGAALLSSSLFLLLHIPILFSQLHLTGISLLVYPISIFLLSFTNCYLYSLRGSLVLPILVHAFWNMTVALYL